ncbi:YihY/virulence factor BrkB family protein [Bremerella alba]|nr:YihY/virulence factor BrkB family protein [Bremerella alba]
MFSEAPKNSESQSAMLEPWKNFCSQFVLRWVANDNPTSAAAVAFYVLFSIAPIFIFAVTIGGKVLESNAQAEEEVRIFLEENLGEKTGEEIVNQILSAYQEHSLTPTIFSAFIILWSSSATFMQLRNALNRIYGFSAEGIRGSILAVTIGRMRATLFAIGTGLLLALISLFSVWSHTIWAHLPLFRLVPLGTQEWITSQTISWISVLLVFYCMLRFLPMNRPPWREVLTGALFATLLFQAGKYIISTIAGSNLVAVAYGPGSVLVVTVMWIFLSANLLLFAAELGHMLFSPLTSPFEKHRQRKVT